MKRVLHTFESHWEAVAELRQMSMRKPHARTLYAQSRIIDGDTEHVFVDISGDGLRRIQGLEVHEHVPHFQLSIAQEAAVRSRVRL